MWARILNIFIGLWLMVSPAVLHMNTIAADNNHIVGPLVITFAVVSLWQINRNAVKANIVLGLWLLIGLFVLNFNQTIIFLLNGICGVLIILLSSIKRKTSQKFGGGWRSLFQHNPPHMVEAERRALKQDV